MPERNRETTRDFRVGDTVRYADPINRTSGRGTVVRVMPAEDTVRKYRIRIEDEQFERAVDAGQLTREEPSAGDRLFDL